MAAILLIVLSRDCATPRKNKQTNTPTYMSKGLFQRNVAQGRSSIETHYWNTILKFLLLGDFTGKVVFYRMPKYALYVMFAN